MPFFNDHGAATHGNLCYCFDVCVCVCFRLQCIEHARFTLAKVGEGKKKKRALNMANFPAQIKTASSRISIARESCAIPDRGRYRLNMKSATNKKN